MTLRTQIHLSFNRRVNVRHARFRVTKVVNLTAPLPGDMLKQTDVDKLLDDDRNDRRQDLTLTITPKK